MLQLKLTAVVHAGSWGENGGGHRQAELGLSGPGLLHPGWAAGGVAVGGHIPSIRVNVGQPHSKNALVQRALASPHISTFLSCKKGTEIFLLCS